MHEGSQEGSSCAKIGEKGGVGVLVFYYTNGNGRIEAFVGFFGTLRHEAHHECFGTTVA